MKKLSRHFCFLLLSFSLLFNSSFFQAPNLTYAINQTNTPATVVLGQNGFDACDRAPNYGDMRRGFSTPIQTLIVNNKLMVSDYANSRIFIYNTIPDSYLDVPDVVIGQNNLCNNLINKYQGPTIVAADTLYYPYYIYSDGTKLFVADYLNNRVLIYNEIPTSNNASADVVIGQPNMTSNTANNGGLGANTLYRPLGVYSDNTKLYIADTSNNRVLVYNEIPTSNNASADVVIGQPNMTSNTANNGGRAANRLNAPYAITVNNGKIYISDLSNNRVLIFNSIPTSNDASADIVVGQTNMTNGAANQGVAVASNTLSSPIYTQIANNKLYITDRGNHRVLVYNSIPIVNNTSADLVIGQPNMTSNTANNGGISSQTLNNPTGLSVTTNKMIITDSSNHRLLIFNTLPLTNNPEADIVIGQKDFTHNLSYMGAVNSQSLSAGWNTAFSDGQRLYVVDYANNRVLIYNSIPTDSNTPADVVIGQPDMTSNIANNGGLSAKSLNHPVEVFAYQNKLYISDYSNSRVLIFNTIPSTNFAEADIVIGQPNMTSNTANNGGLGANTLYYPGSTYTNGEKLIIADYNNHRVLIYNTIPTNNNASADVVVGQPNMTTRSINYGGLSASSLYYPYVVSSNGSNLVVTDYSNSRILIYNSIPTSNLSSADVVVGQPNMTSNGCNNGGINANTVCNPWYAYTDGIRLFIADTANYRILIYNSIPTNNFTNADILIGQLDFTHKDINQNGDASQYTLTAPYSVITDNHNLIVYDAMNYRVLFYPLGPQNTGVTTDSYSNSQNIDLTLSADDAKEMMISEDSGFTGVSWESFSTSKDFTLSTIEGSKTVYVKMRDYANYEGDTLSTTLTYDATSPTGSLTINSGATTTNSRGVTLTLSADDALSGVVSMMISEDSGFNGASWENYDTSKDWILTSGDGIKTVYAKYKDVAGNISERVSGNIEMDTNIPEGEIIIVSPTENAYVNSETVTLTLEGTDELTEVFEMMISEDPNFIGASWETYTTTKEWTFSEGDGIKVIYIKYRDSAQNESLIYSSSIILDTVTTIDLTKLGGNTFNTDITDWEIEDNKPSFEGTGEVDAEVVVTINSDSIIGTSIVDSGGNWICTPETEIPVGKHEVTITSTDLASNTDTLSFNLSVLGATDTQEQIEGPEELPNTGVQTIIIFFMVIALFWTATNLRIIDKLRSFMKR